MENGLPDPKRQRVGEAWQGRSLPLPTVTPTHGPPPASPSGPPDHLPPFGAPPRPLSRPNSHPNHFDDRRPGPEIGYSQYQQDPHRPSSTVAHAYSPHRTPREFTMKRDPAEDHYPPPPNRSNSNGHMSDHHPGQHDGLPRPQMIYDPVQTPGSQTPTTVYRIPPPFAQTPIPQGVPYESQAYGPPTSTPMQQPLYAAKHPSYSSMDSQMKTRKSQRASQACDQCRTAKGKCDEQKPCQRCQENGFNCTFRPPAPKVQDKVQSEIMDTLQTILAQQNQLQSQFLADSARARDEYNQLRRGLIKTMSALETMGGNPKAFQGIMKDDPDDSDPSEGIAKTPPIDPVGLPEPPELPDDQPPSDEEEGADPGPLQTPQFDISHTTYATNLLSWPMIQEEVEEVVKRFKHQERYLLRNERDRGIIKAYGSGEGLDFSPGYRPLFNHDRTGVMDDALSPEASSPRSDGSNGKIGGFCTPTSEAGLQYQLRTDRPGGLSEDGMHHKLDYETVARLSKSYMENINIMHPIITPSRLESLIQRFYKSVASDNPKSKSYQSAHHNAHYGKGAGHKRGRYSPEPTNWQDEVSEPIRPPRSINTALLFLVLALGKVTEHKDKIPDVIRHHDIYPTHSTPRSGIPRSPYSGSPASTTSAHGRDETASPFANRRMSNDGSRSTNKSTLRNLDVIPGLAYYATASDILGNQAGAYTLQHVHANLLCGLYLGQLGRVLESYTYIFKASSALQVILRPKTERLSKHAANYERCLPKDNPLVFTFWTCLQLETDILAELPLPFSGILAYEDKIPYPNCLTVIKEDNIEKLIGDSYIAQLYLRKLLNNLHGYYRPGLESQNPFKVKQGDGMSYMTMGEVESKLILFTQADSTHPVLLWKPTDPPSGHILGARLRAKFYGAQVVLYRPFIKDILEENWNKARSARNGDDVENSSDYPRYNDVSLEGLPGGHPLAALKRSRNEPIAPHVLQWAQTGIEALINSTEAFHNLGDHRLVVTNVFGTAHAQWGNLLVLTVAHKDPVLSKWISKEKLQYLYAKTLHFLNMNAQPHSALSSDIQILVHVGKRNGLLPTGTPMNVEQSFPSYNGSGSGT